jgi:hypothetical protein
MKRVLGFAIFQASTEEFLVDFEEEFDGLGVFKWGSHPKDAKLFPVKKRQNAILFIKQLVLEHGKHLTLVEIIDVGNQFKVVPHQEYFPEVEIH